MVAQAITPNIPDGFLDISEERDGGLLKKVVKKGFFKLKVEPYDCIHIHFMATHYGGELHGQEIDTSKKLDKPLRYMLNDKNMLRAFLVCIPTMKVGEICELIASPDYAYRNEITVKFTLEFLDTDAQQSQIDIDGPFKMTTLEYGRGRESPFPGFEANISYRRFLCVPEEEFRDLTYLVADLSKGVPRIVDMVVRQMKKGDRILIREYTGDMLDYREYRQHKIAYEVKLNDFQTIVKLSSLCNSHLEISQTEELKARADGFMKDEKYDIAIAIYEELKMEHKKLSLMTRCENIPTNLRLAILLNLSLAYLKTHDKYRCVTTCQEILKLDHSNEKALFRLAQIHMDSNDPERAAEYFRMVVSLNPDNSLAVNQLKACSELIKSSERKQRTNLMHSFERMKAAGFGDFT